MIKKIKIMHIINNLETGGAEKILVLLLNELSKREDLELYVVSLEGHGDLTKELSKRVIVKEFNYHLFRRLSNRLDLNFRLSLFKYVRKIKPDIIHGHLFKGEDFAKTLGALTKTPVITTSHDILIWPRRARFLNKYLSKAVAVSEIVANHLQSAYKLEKEKIKIIPNAIQTKLFENSKKKFNKEKPVFIYIGRLLKSKGIDDAITGLAKLKTDYPKLKFLIYGRAVFGKYQEELEKLVLKNKWDFVKFMGKTDDVPAALGKGDIFLYPSQSEGFAISVLEAAAASKPVIATRTGAIESLVENNKSGILVEWNKPDQIYLAAKKILDNDLVEEYGLAARNIARFQFDINKIEKIYYDLYTNSINSRDSN